MTPRLRDHEWQIAYSPGDDRQRRFYIPALSASIRYDRTTGFFSSASLAAAAVGMANLIRNGGHMRLLTGAQLSHEDVEALTGGADMAEIVATRLLEGLTNLEELIARDRLAALAWMAREGLLEVRVVLPKGKDGRPLPGDKAREYFHVKEGLFVDAFGDEIAFNGSLNESVAGWEDNYESFMVYRSWEPGERAHLASVRHRITSIWENREDDWITIPLPEAVKAELIRYAAHERPRRDPLEPAPEAEENVPPASSSERILFQFLRDARYLPNAGALGQSLATIRPWPHQTLVADAVTSTWPHGYLLCDEVGLGKTIEAGLILKRLTLSGTVRRALILAPKSVCRQWQEELYEKFLLNVPLYDGGQFSDYAGNRFEGTTANPWDAFPIILASSQLAKRKERTRELHRAKAWDLILVDEAHHARRKDFLSGEYRRNRLLSLLLGEQGDVSIDGLARPERCRCLIMMTATPMQVDRREVWDLLTVLGIGGRWGASEDAFIDFFDELSRPEFGEINWEFVLAMVRDYLEHGGRIDERFAAFAVEKVGSVAWERIKRLPSSDKIDSTVRQLDTEGRAILHRFVRRHTPLAEFIHRNTRTLLREYQKRGYLGDNKVPTRLPVNEWIGMTADERALYDRIEEYISHFYKKYEAKRKGLGFVMTVYRRRLTSSFYAICESLQRRLLFLQGEAGLAGGLTEEDLEQEELSEDIGEELEAEAAMDRSLYAEEIEYVRDFLYELGGITVDSKVVQLKHDIMELFKTRESLLVFTLYTDTMDFLRDELRPVYGSRVACYSGRGGEVWDGREWRQTTKEEVKNAFKQGEISILLCTESASEGLNLQTCGILINYDMAWNPMRIEQRIGRIDRIGQRYEQVWIRNYFYEGTVEARIYQALQGRIHWFESVVGELQPILAKVAQAIQEAAMAYGADREAVLQLRIEELGREYEQRSIESLNLDEYLAHEVVLPKDEKPPVTWKQIQDLFITSTRYRGMFTPHTQVGNAWWLDLNGARYAVTFDPETFDAHPNTVRFLSYQDDLFEGLLAEGDDDGNARMPSGIIRLSADEPPLRAYYRQTEDGVDEINAIDELQAALATEPVDVAPDGRQKAEQLFAQLVKVRRQREETSSARKALDAASRLEERLKDALQESAILFAVAEWGEEIREKLPLNVGEYLGRRGYPYDPALRLVDMWETSITSSMPRLELYIQRRPSATKNEIVRVRKAIDGLVQQLASMKK